jgi:hypothetical protein
MILFYGLQKRGMPQKQKMTGTQSSGLNKGITLGFIVFLWVVTAWLLYPLMILDSVDMENAKEYLYRSAMGIAIMIIFYGKTIFDLLFPDVYLKRTPRLNSVFLIIYSFALGGGIVYMFVRFVILFLKSQKRGLIF